MQFLSLSLLDFVSNSQSSVVNDLSKRLFLFLAFGMIVLPREASEKLALTLKFKPNANWGLILFAKYTSTKCYQNFQV